MRTRSNSGGAGSGGTPTGGTLHGRSWRGANGAGKSSFLRALNVFFGTARGLTLEDVHNRAPDTEIRITVTFAGLSNEVSAEVADYLVDGELAVTKIVSLDGRPMESYHGRRPTNPEFDTLRRVPAAEMAKQYAALRSTEKYQSLPHETTKKAMLPALDQWERDHPGECELAEDAGDFFGMGTGTFAIKDHVEFVLVPAVREASADVTGNGFVPALLNRLAQSLLIEAAPTKEAFDKAKTDVLATIRPAENAKLMDATTGINKTLREMAPTAGIRVNWTEADLDLVPPRPSVEVGEDSYCTAVGRSGHGVQRALVMAILQHQAAYESRAAAEDGRAPKQLILAIEEPELYQHPNRQRHLADVLHQLATGAGAGVMESTQVIVATHSPLFVHLDYFDSVRRAFKEATGEGLPLATRIVKVDMSALTGALAALDGKSPEQYNLEALRARLRAVMTPWMNEGFFAQKIILVEGESDRAAIMALARHQDVALDARGISVIPANGKNKLEKPYLIFSKLKIPTFVMWDGDFKPDPGENEKKKQENSLKENRRLLQVVGAAPEDFPEGVYANHAVHKANLETTLRDELGEDLYGKVLDDAASTFGYSGRDDVLKSAAAMQHALDLAFKSGGVLTFLPQVLHAIDLM